MSSAYFFGGASDFWRSRNCLQQRRRSGPRFFPRRSRAQVRGCGPWLIFALPPGEAAFHPSNENGPHELYFICDALKTEMASLRNKGVKCSEVEDARWGSITKIRLPGGGEIGLYQPKHPTALSLGLK
jgi:hypothetical protein